jgi:tetratricopeptide (TPR) repeat protein
MYPDSYFAWLIMANDYAHYESSEARINDYNRAIAINEFGYYAPANLARLHQLDDQLDLAVEGYQRVIDIDPYQAEIYLSMAYLYRSRFEDVDKAMEYIEKALELDPNLAEAYAFAATSYAYYLGDRGKALQNFEMAFQTNPTNINVWMEAYAYYSRIGEYKRALEYNDVIISYEPIESRVYRDRAQIFFAMGRYEEAYESLDIYWDDYSDYYQGVGLIQILRAIIALQESNYTYAAEQIDIAFTVTSWWPLQWNEMRGLRIYDSRSYLAQQYYQKTIDAPDFPDSYLQLGHIMVEFGQWEVALEHYRHYLSLVDDPDVVNLVDVIASHVEGS